MKSRKRVFKIIIGVSLTALIVAVTSITKS